MAKPGKKPLSQGEFVPEAPGPVEVPAVVSEDAYVRDPRTGELSVMRKEDAALAIRTGRALPASEEEAEHRRQGQLLRDQATGGEAAFVGLLRGLTGRLSDAELAATPSGREELNAVTEAHPWITGGTEVAGAILPFTRIGQAGRFATFPGVADAVGSTFARALRYGEPGLTRVALSRMAGTGLEGALYGSSAAYADSAVSDTPLTAEKLWTGITTGAGLGAAFGTPFGILEGIGAAAGKYGDKIRIAKAARGGSINEDDLRRSAAQMLGVPEKEIQPGVLDEFIARMYPEATPEAVALFRQNRKARQEAFIDGEQKLEALIPEAQEALDAVVNVDRVLGKNWQGQLKEQHALRLIKKARPDAQVVEDAFQSYLRNLEQRLLAAEDLEPGFLGKKEGDINRALGLVRQMREDFQLPEGLGPAEAHAKSIQRGGPDWGKKTGAYGEPNEPIQVAERAIENIRPGVDVRMARQFRALDHVKRRLGGYGKGHGWLGSDENVARLMRSEYENLRGLLEDPRVWGEGLSGMQREINEIYHPRLFMDRHFKEAFMSGRGMPDPDNAYVEWLGPSQEKLRAHFKSLVAESKSETHQMLLRHIEQTKKLGARLKEFFELEPGEAKAVEAGMSNVDNALAKLNQASELAQRINQGKALKQLGLLGNGIWAPIIGSALFGLPGFLAGQGIMLAINPGKYIAARAVFDKLVDQANLRVSAGISGFLSGAGKKAVSVARAVKGAAAPAYRSGKSGIAALARQGEKPQETYRRVIGELDELPDQADRLEALLRDFVGRDADTLAPRLIPNMAMQARRVRQEVLKRAPAMIELDPILGKAQPLFASETEMDMFADVYRAATDPASILDAMQEHRLTTDMVDVAEISAPSMVAEIRTLIQTVGSDPRVDVGYEERRELSILFRVPMDPTLSAEYVAMQQAVHAARLAKFQKAAGRQQDRSTHQETGVNKSLLTGADRRELAEPPR